MSEAVNLNARPEVDGPEPAGAATSGLRTRLGFWLRNDASRLLRAVAGDTGLAPDRLTVHRIGEAVAAQVGPGALGVAVVEAEFG